MSVDRSTSRRAGDRLIVNQAQRQVQTFFDDLKNGTRIYRSIASLEGQIAQSYRGRCILELLQNTHDALANAEPDDPQRISFVLSTSPEPVLLVGNSGRPFRTEDFKGICQLGQSPKDPNKSVGNKGLGFRSVLEVSTWYGLASSGGGDDDPEQAKRICAVVKHLPNRWPEVRQVAVGIAVEEASEPQQGVFVIFLPTEMTTGTGAHINAPFYGSLDRRQIDFNDNHYNELLLESVLDLCLDVVIGLVLGQPEDWRAQAVIDILSSTALVGGKDWCFMDRLHKRASERNSALDDQGSDSLRQRLVCSGQGKDDAVHH